MIEAGLGLGSDRHRSRWEEPLRDGRWDRARRCRSCSGRRRAGVPPGLRAVGSLGYDGAGLPGRRCFPGVVPGLRLETGRAGELPVAAPGPHWPRHSLSAATCPVGRPLADTALPLSPRGDTEPAPPRPRQHRGHRAPLYRDTAIPCESQSAHILLLRLRIPGESPPSDRGCSAEAAAPAAAVPGVGPEEARSPRRTGSPHALGSAGGAVPAACQTHVPAWTLGYRDSAGADTAKALPVAPQPGAALNRQVETPQPGQTPPTAQKDSKEQLALPGMEARAVCRGPQTAVPISDLPELPHSCQIWNPKQYTLEMP
ncbi:uncharacterized protein [Agelaius tricolor]|uniref:uncharacterized protein n=1 Tax=Agelaius tricolor TaxID=9191 RepID=UPI0039F20E56